MESKWIKVEDQLPDDDRLIILWIENDLHPHWSEHRFGCYQNKKFYARGGIDTSCEKVLAWANTLTRYTPLVQPKN